MFKAVIFLNADILQPFAGVTGVIGDDDAGFCRIAPSGIEKFS